MSDEYEEDDEGLEEEEEVQEGWFSRFYVRATGLMWYFGSHGCRCSH